MKNFVNKHGLLFQTRHFYMYICVFVYIYVYIYVYKHVHSRDYLKKNSIKTNVPTDEANGRNET